MRTTTQHEISREPASTRPTAALWPLWLVGTFALAWGLSGCLRAGFPSNGTVDGQGIDAGVDGGMVDGGTVDGGRTDSGSPDVSPDVQQDVPPDVPPGCTSAAQCDDGDPCTQDECDAATGQCAHYTAPGCTGDPCMGPNGKPRDCDDGDYCTDDWCDPDTGACLHKAIPGCGKPCINEDGQPTDCDDGDPCTKDWCDPATATCGHAVMPGCGSGCVDASGNVKDCDDGDPCTEDGCDPTTGQCVYKPLPGCGEPCVGPNGVPLDCDDGDPCTKDWCDPTVGGCGHTPIPNCGSVCPSTAECQDDAGCGDSDPCTKDLCVNCACEHVQISNCGPTCNGMVCDDGDPCTADACFEGQCLFEPIPGCGVTPTPTCSGQGVVPISDVLWAPAGDVVKIGGTPQAGNFGGCTEMGCPSDNPCCNQCSAVLLLTDPQGASMQASTMLDSELPWSCTTDDYGNALSCQPPMLETAYWAWGELLPGQAYPIPAGVAAAPNNALGVQGWCIQTNEDGLPGHYEGVIKLDDPVTGQTTQTPVTMDITLAADGWHIAISPADASGGGIEPQEAYSVVIGDGFIEFWLDASTGMMTSSVPVHLDSWHNHLQGPVGMFATPPPIPLPAPSGAADFEKLPANQPVPL